MDRPTGQRGASRYRAEVRISSRRFEAMVAEALDAIPPDLGALMENVAVLVADWATPEQLASVGITGDRTLLGLYEGVDLTRRSVLTYNFALPDRITIFRGPHLALRHDGRLLDDDELIDEIAGTVIHEIAHHFGIDDARLAELGW
jgi:predicted Zn-dependent protease with MMP-like domain